MAITSAKNGGKIDWCLMPTLAVVGRNMEGRRIRKKEKPFKSERYDEYTHNIT
jgi:hypothetical protein